MLAVKLRSDWSFKSANVVNFLATVQGVPIKELCRRYGVSDAAFYAWRKKDGALGAEEMRRLQQLEDENRRSKGLVADIARDKQILQDVLSKKV